MTTKMWFVSFPYMDKKVYSLKVYKLCKAFFLLCADNNNGLFLFLLRVFVLKIYFFIQSARSTLLWMNENVFRLAPHDGILVVVSFFAQWNFACIFFFTLLSGRSAKTLLFSALNRKSSNYLPFILTNLDILCITVVQKRKLQKEQ